MIYDDLALAAAENRLETTLAELREAGIEADGEVMDPDPYAATMDGIAQYHADEIIISTHPETRSGWLRRDLVERIRGDSGLPVDARGGGPRRRPRAQASAPSWWPTRPSAGSR